MPDDPRVQELLDQLFDEQLTLDEIEVDYPDLSPTVTKRWNQICRARDAFDVLLPSSSGNDTSILLKVERQLPDVPGYIVEKVLGHGGMGIVFRARHVRLNRMVALKMTLGDCYASEYEQKRFGREVETVAALQHPNIIQIYDVGDLGGRPFFTMELLEGGNLAESQSILPRSAKESAELIATLAETVHAAHQGGVIHRDLKPGNILFALDRTPKITDFGLARRAHGCADLTLSGVPLGTPNYMAPEQARGLSREIGPATDIYALGAILYELLTGRPPFSGETPTETLMKVINDDLIAPSKIVRKLPRDLETICLTCLQKEPRRRYVTAAALADDLRSFLRGDTIFARPESYATKWIRRICRKPLLTGAVAIAVMSLVAFAAIVLWVVSDRSAKAQAAHDDVRDMILSLNQSAWSEARAARDRANGRLGESAPKELKVLIDQGTKDLETAKQLEEFRARGIEAIAGGSPFQEYHNGLMNTLRNADFGSFGDPSDEIAMKIRDSNIRNTLLSALDWYAVISVALDRDRAKWALDVARMADPDQSPWRLRTRDLPSLEDSKVRQELISMRPESHPSLIPLTLLEMQLNDEKIPISERLKLLKQLYQERSNDFWINLRLGAILFKASSKQESLGHLQSATVLRPESAIAHVLFGNVLNDVGRREESAEQFRLAIEIDPTTKLYQQIYARRLSEISGQSNAVEYLERAVKRSPGFATAHWELSQALERSGRDTDALHALSKAVELEPTRFEYQKSLRGYWLKRGKLQNAQTAWQSALAIEPSQYSYWYGYPELCLFLGLEDEYRRARHEMLRRFSSTIDLRECETMSRMCLLAPTSESELGQAVKLCNMAVDSASAKNGGYYSFFLFAQGLAQYRQGKFDKAIATMNGNAARVLGPCPRLVIAMSHFRNGNNQEALQTLAKAISSHDWQISKCKNQDAWIYHLLRREAEALILQNLNDYLDVSSKPNNNDERFSLIGAYRLADRQHTLAKIYYDAFESTPSLMTLQTGHRYYASRAAARAGFGTSSDSAELDEATRKQWRDQAIKWLAQDLALHEQALQQNNEQTHTSTLQKLRQWLSEDDLRNLRDPDSLETLSIDEQNHCRELWEKVRMFTNQPLGSK